MKVYTLRVKTRHGDFSEINPSFLDSILGFITSVGSELRETHWMSSSKVLAVEFAHSEDVRKQVEDYAAALESQLDVAVA